MILTSVLTVTAFAVGTKYGARIEKQTVAVALAAFTKAKAALSRVIFTAQADAKAEALRLEELVKKYL